MDYPPAVNGTEYVIVVAYPEIRIENQLLMNCATGRE